MRRDQEITGRLWVVSAVSKPHMSPMNLKLTDEEADALAKLLTRTIDGDRYFLSSRVQTLRAILGKLRPEPARPAASPEPRVYAPPKATAARRRR